MNKRSILLAGTARSQGWFKGRMIRDESGHPGAGGLTIPPAAGNGGQGDEGNQGGGASGESGDNNAGDAFDPASFWSGQAPAGGANPSGESAGANGGESGTGNGQPDNTFRDGLVTQLNGMKFGDPVFNAEIAEEINNGNYDGVQGRLETMGRSIVQQALAMQVQILRPFAEQLMQQVRQETQQTFSSRDDKQSLETLFPAAKNPAMAQTIQPIYDQALKNAKGNREKAVAQTKEMLRFMAGTSASDLNLEVAPRGQGDRGGPTPSINWLDELTGR